MDEKVVLKGICKYYRLGSKGNRFKLVIDDPVISKVIQDKIDESIANHKINSNSRILSVQDFIRLKEIEVRIV